MRSAIPPVHESFASRRPPDTGSAIGSVALVLLGLAAIAVGGPILSAAIVALGSIVGDRSTLLVLIAAIVLVAVTRRFRRTLGRAIRRRGAGPESARRPEAVGRPRR